MEETSISRVVTSIEVQFLVVLLLHQSCISYPRRLNPSEGEFAQMLTELMSIPSTAAVTIQLGVRLP